MQSSFPLVRPATPLRNKRAGFALLATIVLVAFLVLLLVGLSVFTRVETSVAGNNQTLSSARQNALMSLNLAIGHLQRYAGPDDQVTARADIAAASAQPYITGTWNNAGTLTSWLVSGNETAPTTVTPGAIGSSLDPATGTYPADDTAGASSVFVVGSSSVNAAADRVRLAKQNIVAPAGTLPGFPAAETTGHYAWWIGDEGIKASAALVDSLAAANAINYNNAPGTDPVGDDWYTDAIKKERLNQLMLPRPKLEGMLTTVNPDAGANVLALPKVLERNQLMFLTGTPAPTAAQVGKSFHDLTPLSRGVLADTNTLKLRSDLSGNTGGGGAVASYQLSRPDSFATPLEAQFFPVASIPSAGSSWPTYQISPVVTEAGIKFFFSVAGGQIFLKYYLEAELWNPYAANFITDGSHILSFSVTFPTKVDFKVTDNTGTPTSQAVSIAAGTTFNGSINTALVWQPGEIRHLRGGATLDRMTAVEPPNQANMGATTLTTVDQVDIQSAVKDLRFDLLLNGGATALQTMTLATNFQTESGISNSGGTAFGYGFELDRDMRIWSEGTQAKSRDPRLPIMGANFEETTASQWSASNPSANAGSGFGTGDLNDGAVFVLFDLPRQEVTSVAQLRHLIGAKSYELGNSWGGAVNNNFDVNYVSTVPRNYAWQTDGSEQRPNRYLEIYYPESAPAGEFDNAASRLASLRNATNSARYQLIHGAFNINSTSVAAWTAVLSRNLTGWDHLGAAVTGIPLANPFFRTDHGAQQRPALSGTIPPLPDTNQLSSLSAAQLLGATGRQLQPSDVTALATQIVSLLKANGRPFTSLAAFINSGIIETAISPARSNLNAAIAGTDPNLVNTAAGITQADVIACLAPFMAARSDTFLVRAYGDVQNPASGAVEGRAWCEATVQRVPDLVSNASAVVATVIAPPVASNPFGRRFKIISFRWLSPNDL